MEPPFIQVKYQIHDEAGKHNDTDLRENRVRGISRMEHTESRHEVPASVTCEFNSSFTNPEHAVDNYEIIVNTTCNLHYGRCRASFKLSRA